MMTKWLVCSEWNSGRDMARWTAMDGKRRLRIMWGPQKWELRCNGMEVMWSENMTRR
jgi:hypothetical protein